MDRHIAQQPVVQDSKILGPCVPIDPTAGLSEVQKKNGAKSIPQPSKRVTFGSAIPVVDKWYSDRIKELHDALVSDQTPVAKSVCTGLQELNQTVGGDLSVTPHKMEVSLKECVAPKKDVLKIEKGDGHTIVTQAAPHACRRWLNDPLHHALKSLPDLIKTPQGMLGIQQALCGYLISSDLLAELKAISIKEAEEEMLWVRVLIYSQYIQLRFLRICYFYFQRNTVLLPWIKNRYFTMDPPNSLTEQEKKDFEENRRKVRTALVDSLPEGQPRRFILQWICGDSHTHKAEPLTDLDILLTFFPGFRVQADETVREFQTLLEPILDNLLLTDEGAPQDQSAKERWALIKGCLRASLFGSICTVLYKRYVWQTSDNPEDAKETFVGSLQILPTKCEGIQGQLKSRSADMVTKDEKDQKMYQEYVATVDQYAAVIQSDLQRILELSSRERSEASLSVADTSQLVVEKPLPASSFERVQEFTKRHPESFQRVVSWPEENGFKVYVSQKKAKKWGQETTSINYSGKKREYYSVPVNEALDLAIDIAKENGERCLDIAELPKNLKVKVANMIRSKGLKVKDSSLKKPIFESGLFKQMLGDAKSVESSVPPCGKRKRVTCD